MADASLKLYEELLLLALHDEKGTIDNSMVAYGMAGALIAELSLDGRIAVDETKKKRPMAEVVDRTPTGHAVLDDALERIATAKRRAALSTWVSRLAGGKLSERVAAPLCERGILQREDSKVLWVFNRTRYPEADSGPEQRLLARLREAIRGDGEVDPRTAILVSLCKGMSLLKRVLPKAELKARKQRIEQIANGEAMGKATAEAIAAVQAALMAAVIVPTIIATTTATH